MSDFRTNLFVDIHDVDYNGVFAEFDANIRNPQKVTLGSNGLHIAASGQHQLADAVYRNVVTRLQEGD